MTEQSPRRTALITGASRGLGLALARALADEGWTLCFEHDARVGFGRIARDGKAYALVDAAAGPG